MAATVTTVLAGQNLFIADVAWGADADTAVDVNHGLGITPLQVSITPTAAAAATVANCATTIDATKVTVTKNGVGAGSAAASSCRIAIARPHSIVR